MATIDRSPSYVLIDPSKLLDDDECIAECTVLHFMCVFVCTDVLQWVKFMVNMVFIKLFPNLFNVEQTIYQELVIAWYWYHVEESYIDDKATHKTALVVSIKLSLYIHESSRHHITDSVQILNEIILTLPFACTMIKCVMFNSQK